MILAERLEAQAKELLAAWDKLNDPTIRAGAVYPNMEKLRDLIYQEKT